MGVAVTGISHPVTFVRQDGPRWLSTRYVMQMGIGANTVSDADWFGPVDFHGEGGFCQTLIHVSNAPSAANTYLLSVYGTFSEASTTPTDRNWLLMRGDRASGAAGVNDTLNAVTLGGEIIITTPARSYLFRISGPTSAVTAPITVNVLAVRSNG